MTTPPTVEATNLHKAFGPTPALRGASLRVADGESVAITGPSGSGKSTLLLCLAGVLTPETGTVNMLGTDLDQLSATARTRLRRREIGLVLQFGQLVPELTATENVGLPLLLEEKNRAAATTIALDWLDRLGVGAVADQRPGELSGGQQQRVAIARALVTAPRLILADEPTGALDSVSAESVLDLLVTTARDTGASLVIVTHDNRVAAAADRDVVLRDGAVERLVDQA
ncbi:ABC transporter ATP-binding protein [Mumia sp. zg.B21]|uniref:ABC transporter ATP-binding protein n=1 Tax=Mumia sp. zg.B21 TaxID=2855447 RepID=UPI001C6E44C5|nr:ABC transporter ATP-binding protein [Mumia sp. zg.B21]MBW9208240.1 ABC transporter ATP-binding protein [Mumia sp. zg.B21]